MYKMRFESKDLTVGNVQKIERMFPGVVTEGKVNFELLRSLLGDEVFGDEAYEFTWVGKRAAISEAGKPVRKTLRPCMAESKNWDTTENLYIEGDNLDVLKLLQESYLGKVKMIYIDPPYNTGNDFVYRDNFAREKDEYEAETGAYDEDGDRLFRNTESNGRFHSDWCSMMYPRLVVARNLLRHDGVIFISIDDHEAAQLRKMCDEIFSENCFISDISWQRTYSTRNDSKGIVNEVEHILVFSKQPDWSPNKLPRTEEMNSIYKNPDNDEKPWRSDNPFAPGASTHQGMVYAIQHPFTGNYIYPSSNACWRYQQNDMLEIMRGWCEYELKDLHDERERAAVCGVAEHEVRKGVMGIVLTNKLEISLAQAQKVYQRGQWPRFFFTKGGMGGICRKTYLDSVGGKLPTNFWPYSETGHTDEAKKEILSLFEGSAPFDTPKPTRLLGRIISIATDEESIVLDFFSGSATTAHSVIMKNAEDQGHRKFIMVQLPEGSQSPDYANLCEIGKERIRRAGEKIRAEIEEANAQTRLDEEPKAVPDIGFRVLKLDTTNMQDVYYTAGEYTQDMLSDMEDNVKPDRNDMDLLFGCLLDWGLPLFMPHTHEVIDGFTVHTYNGGDLIACFDQHISDKVVRKIAKRQPLRAVFRDASFESSPEKINVQEIFKLLAPNTTVKVV